MKKVVLHIVLFLLPILILLILLPVNQRRKYQGLVGACYNQGIWIHDRINISNKPIDVAFLGSSHTMNGLDDRKVTDISGRQCVNLGYCKLGRNLTYVLAKELMKRDLKTLVVEVRENEDRYSHEVFPFIASTKDVLTPELLFNKDIGSDIFTHLAFKIELNQDKLYKQQPEFPYKTEDFGSMSPDDTASILSSVVMDMAEQNDAGSLKVRFHSKYAMSYLEKVSELCLDNDVELVFIYLPAYNSYALPTMHKSFNEFGRLLIPPKEILDNPDYWYDTEHLNFSGATALSKWLAQEL